MSKILIIGGSGFIGSHVANYFYESSHNTIVFDQKKNILLNKKIKIYFGNIVKSKVLEKLIKKSDYVFNFAALSDIDFANVDLPLPGRPLNSINSFISFWFKLNLWSTTRIPPIC